VHNPKVIRQGYWTIRFLLSVCLSISLSLSRSLSLSLSLTLARSLSLSLTLALSLSRSPDEFSIHFNRHIELRSATNLVIMAHYEKIHTGTCHNKRCQGLPNVKHHPTGSTLSQQASWSYHSLERAPHVRWHRQRAVHLEPDMLPLFGVPESYPATFSGIA